MRNVVVFPAPFGPRKPVMVPGPSSNDKPATADSAPYFFVTLSNRTGAAVGFTTQDCHHCEPFPGLSALSGASCGDNAGHMRTAQVCADAVVGCGAQRAMARLPRVLDAPPNRPDAPARVWVTVGPRRGLLLRKRVSARVGPPRPHRWTEVSPLWWTPTGRLGRFYPMLHAGLAITAIDETSSLLCVVGEYVPPLGRLGGLLDRMGLNRIAGSTVHEFTVRLAAALAEDRWEK